MKTQHQNEHQYFKDILGKEFVQALSFFSNPFHYNIFMNCMQHDYCDEINMFKLRIY